MFKTLHETWSLSKGSHVGLRGAAHEEKHDEMHSVVKFYEGQETVSHTEGEASLSAYFTARSTFVSVYTLTDRIHHII